MDKESKERPAFAKRQARSLPMRRRTSTRSTSDPSAPSIASSSHGSPTIACLSGCCMRCLALHLGRGLLLGSF